eukprot:270712_1
MMLVLLCLIILFVLTVAYLWIKFAPPIIDASFGGLFALDFVASDNESSVIKEIKPLKFPKSNSMFYNHSDFFSLNKEIISKTVVINEFIEIMLNETPILTPFFMDSKLNVIMIETPNDICLTNDTDTKMAFFLQAQAEFCRKNVVNKMYSIPFKSLSFIINVIQEKLNHINYEILFIHNMGRCGSNFICNLLSNHKTIQCVKETNILVQIQHLYANQMNYKNDKYNSNSFTENMIDLIHANIMLLVYGLLKNTNYTKNKIVFKTSSQIIFISHLICKALSKYNNCKHIYMYRNAFDQIDSMYSAFILDITFSRSWTRFITIAIKNKYVQYYFVKFMKYLSAQLLFKRSLTSIRLFANVWGGINDTDVKLLNDIQNHNLLPIMVMNWYNSINIAYELLQKKVFIAAIRYDDLKQNPQQMTHKLLQTLKWLDVNENYETDTSIYQKTIKTDSHNLKGGLRSHRKNKVDFVVLNKYDVQYIKEHVKLSKYKYILNDTF